jgi:mediator of RNA polymerase II transcription subunit 7
MAEQEQPQQLPEAPFPAPPPFWKHFTAANEQELRKIESEAVGEESQEKLPLHLAYLRPPPPPPAAAEFYTTFGQNQVIDPTKPSSLPREQLLFDPDDPTLNHAVLLSTLTKSLLLNFLELTSVLALDPTKHEEKLEDIRQLILNVHIVINIHRPHQARESVKEMLEGLLEDGQREIDECDRLKQKVEAFLGTLESPPNPGGLNGMSHGKSGSLEDKTSHDAKLDEQRQMWKMIHDMT